MYKAEHIKRAARIAAHQLLDDDQHLIDIFHQHGQWFAYFEDYNGQERSRPIPYHDITAYL